MNKCAKILLGVALGVPVGVVAIKTIDSLMKVRDIDFDSLDSPDDIEDLDVEFEDSDIEEDWDDAESLKTGEVKAVNLHNPFDNKFVRETLGYEVGNEFNLKEKAGIERDEAVMEILSLSPLYSDSYLNTLSDLALWIILYQLRKLTKSSEK